MTLEESILLFMDAPELRKLIGPFTLQVVVDEPSRQELLKRITLALDRDPALRSREQRLFDKAKKQAEKEAMEERNDAQENPS